MKPDILFRIMDDISPDYIAEAKPRYTRTRPVRKHISARTAPAADEFFSQEPAVRQNRRKDNTMKGSVIQRVTTGMVAAAALAVFVGGGVFIAKQQAAKSQTNSPAAQIAEQKAVNFLGGTGEVKPYKMDDLIYSYSHDMLYDNDNLYLSDVTVPRSGALLAEFSQSEKLQNILCDGVRFYERDGSLLNIVAQDGTRTPFLNVAEFEANLDFTPELYYIFAIFRLSDDIYFVEYTADSGRYHAALAVLYHADTGEAEQFTGEGAFGSVQPDGCSGFYCIENNDLAHYTVTPELTCRKYHLSIEGYVIDSLERYVISQDQRFAYLLARPQDDLEKLSYLRLDLESGEPTVLYKTAPFTHFQEANGKLYTLSPAKTELWCSDLDFSSHEVIWKPDADTPQDFREQLNADNWECGVLTANSDYIVMSIGPLKYGIFDLNTNTMRYIRVVETAAETEQQTAEQQQTEPQEQQQIIEINGKRVLTDGEQRYTTEQNQIWLLDDAENEIPFFNIDGIADYRYCGNRNERLRDLVPENTVLTAFNHVWGDMYVYQGYEYNPETDEYVYFTGYTDIVWVDWAEKYLPVTVALVPSYLAQYPLTISRISEEEKGFYFELDGKTYFTECIDENDLSDVDNASPETNTFLVNSEDGSKIPMNWYGDAPLEQTQSSEYE